MAGDVLSQILILLAGSVLVLSLVRRFRLPPILGYLLVGMVLGPHALGLAPTRSRSRTLAEIGVVFLVFTLGLEFSFARMVAMKAEVLGVGGLQMLLTTAAIGGVAWALGARSRARPSWSAARSRCRRPRSCCGSSATSSNSTARTRGSPSASCCSRTWRSRRCWRWPRRSATAGQVPGPQWLLGMVGRGDRRAGRRAACVGRWLLRPLFHEIARHRSTETFTLTVLFVALGGAWATARSSGCRWRSARSSPACCSPRPSSGTRPKRSSSRSATSCSALFFVSVGMLLDLRLLRHAAAAGAAAARGAAAAQGGDRRAGRAAVRAEHPQGAAHRHRGVHGRRVRLRAADAAAARATRSTQRIVQPLLTAVALSMLLGPLLVRYNGRIADRILRRRTGPAVRGRARDRRDARTRASAST